MEEICVKFPRTIELVFNEDEEETIEEIKEIVTLELYKQGKISVGKAAEILGLSKSEMLTILSFRKIPINYDINDLKEDIKTLEKVNQSNS